MSREGERREDLIASGDLVIDAQVRARELRVRVAPRRVAIEQWAAPGCDGVKESEREGLPQTLRRGDRYRGVLVRFRLVTRVLPRPRP
jgi:hypothetical protein